MASDKLSCINDPNFASVVNFLMRFSSECNIDELNIEELASMLENSDEVAPAIEDIHTKLLRKIRKTVPSGKWENVLAKFAYTYSSMQDAWELERFGYKKSSLSVKLRVLKALVESQFDRNVKFKSYINGIAAPDLRVEPVGRDMLGNIYWCIMDKFKNIRIFRENPDDESWNVVASNREEMVRLIEKLSSNDIEIFSVKSPIDEDSCSTDSSIHSEEKSENIKILSPMCNQNEKSESKDIDDQDECKPDNNVEKNETTEKLKLDSTEETNNESETTNGAPIVESSSTNSKNESDTTKDESKAVIEKPAETESEAEPVFSSVITEPVLIIQGQGNGEENDMGNVKNGDNSNSTTSTASDSTSTKIDLPLKKKINKSYCESVSGSVTSQKQKDEELKAEIKEEIKLSPKKNQVKTENLVTDQTEKSTNESPTKEEIVKIESTSTEKLVTKKASPNISSKSKSPEQENSTKKENDVSKDLENDGKQQETPSATEDSQPATRGKRGRKTRSGLVDGLDISQVIDSSNDGPPVRQSRRIAQQKIKEETDRRMIEEKMLREMKKEAIRKKKTASHSEDEEYVVSDSENSKNTTESSRIKKKKSDKPWLSSTSESSSETEPEEDYIEHDNYESRRSPYKSDHEFSPESDLETECAVPTKRARTVKAEGYESDNESVDSNVDHACQKCGKTDHPEWILLCDSCDKGHHCSCLTPVLFIIPEGDWFCPKCQHEKLVENLQKTLLQYDEVCSRFEILKKLEQQENEEQRIKKECAADSDQDGPESDQSQQSDKSKGKKERLSAKRGSGSSSSSETDDEDDIPIYKLRRRNQNSNYRFNDYDDLINSAINRGITEDNEPITCGKDIRNIIKSNSMQETVSTKSKSRSRSNSPIVEKSKTNRRKNVKKKKLNNLDDTSDDNESDTDFKEAETSTETDNSLTEESESSLELSLARKSRKARKKLDMEFINDGEESDKSTYNMRKQRKKIQKILEDSDDFDEDEMTESEEIDSADLCSDTETDSSRENRRGKTKQTNNAKVAAEKSTTINRKRKVKKPDDDKAYRSGMKKKTKVEESVSSSSDDDKALNTLGRRRTRGKKLHYILDDEFESSDDGITPGVQRPDTPPEERERFIKKQEEIKRMLAEKNTAAAKELATPKIKSLTESGEPCKQAPLSVVPMQVIEGAKALDMDFLKSAKAIEDGVDDFDDELAVNFSDPGDVNEDELAKIMEEEDFAQHQLKLDDEALARKAAAEISPKKKIRDFDALNPSDITKIDKKSAASVSVEKSYKQDCLAPRTPAIGIEHEHGKPFMHNYLPGKPNELHPYFLTNYPCVPPPPPPVVSTSILQQMKQQAIPLQGCQQPIKFMPPPTPALSESQYMPAPVPLVSSVPLVSNKVADVAPPNLPKDVGDIRRRRRKKITPLRGDLYKAMDDPSLAKPVSHLHYHLPPTAPAPETVTTDYIKSKQPVGVVSIPASSTHETESLKPTEVDLRYPPGAYAPSSMFPPRAPAANINTGALTSSSGLQEPPSSRPSFITLEPVNAVDQAVESPAVSENIGNVTADAESSSEFSGLVSYFSSQQNELNA